MKTWQKAALGIIGVGAAGYFIYNRFKNSNAVDVIEPEVLTPGTTTPNNEPSSYQFTPSTVSNVSFKDKIKKLQQIIGVTADGVAGPQTMAKLNQIITLNTLSTANIDSVTKKVDVIVRAVNALAFNRNNTPEHKKARWDYWIKEVNKVDKMTFDPWVTKAYLTLTKRSLYADYANRLSGLESAASEVSVMNIL